MRITLNTDNQSFGVSEAEDLKRLDAVVVGTGAVAPVVAGHGEADPDGEHLWINIQSLRDGAGQRDAAWHGSFDKMIDYARSKGWLDSAGQRVQVHIAKL